MDNEKFDLGDVRVEEIHLPNGKNNIYGKVYYPSLEGKHPAIIISHGFNGTNKTFERECIHYAKNGYVACGYDFCGGSIQGKSIGASTDMTISTEKSDLMTVFNYISSLDEVDENNIVLIGESMGGMVTALVAKEIPQKVKSVVLYYPALCIPDDWRERFPKLEDVPKEFDFWGLMLGKGYIEDIHDMQIFEAIEGYPGKVLIMHGDMDEVVDFEYSEKAASIYQNCELVKMVGQKHGFTLEAGLEAMDRVLKFANSSCI